MATSRRTLSFDGDLTEIPMVSGLEKSKKAKARMTVMVVFFGGNPVLKQ